MALNKEQKKIHHLYEKVNLHEKNPTKSNCTNNCAFSENLAFDWTLSILSFQSFTHNFMNCSCSWPCPASALNYGTSQFAADVVPLTHRPVHPPINPAIHIHPSCSKYIRAVLGQRSGSEEHSEPALVASSIRWELNSQPSRSGVTVLLMQLQDWGSDTTACIKPSEESKPELAAQ